MLVTVPYWRIGYQCYLFLFFFQKLIRQNMQEDGQVVEGSTNLLRLGENIDQKHDR